jgi:regulator of protease activity HflC (stomatin/prohibitin superfamily)
MKRAINWFKWSFLLIIIAMLVSCAKVDKGYEAAQINTLGTDKGGIKILETGRHYYNPIKYDLIINPIFIQEYVWTADEEEGSRNDESIAFQSSDSMIFKANVGAKIRMIPGKTGDLYVKYHKRMDQIMQTNFKNTLRDSFNRQAAGRDAEALYGAGKIPFVKAIEKDIQETWKEFLIIERVYLVGPLIPPDQLIASINKKIEATQKARQRENEVAEETAKANKIIAAAKGAAESVQLAATAEAFSITAKAEAQATAIKLVQKQLEKSPVYVEYIKAKRWDGVLPQYMAGSAPLPMIGVKSIN